VNRLTTPPSAQPSTPAPALGAHNRPAAALAHTLRVHGLHPAVARSSSLLSSLIGLGRGKFIAWRFGAGPQTDAYVAAFRLPDLMNNFLVGGAVAITFVTILNRYREQGDEAEGERLLFTVLNLMVLVLTAATVVLMFLAGPFIHFTNPDSPRTRLLCVRT
jgi:putative peptidoglycan lipid II flippase